MADQKDVAPVEDTDMLTTPPRPGKRSADHTMLEDSSPPESKKERPSVVVEEAKDSEQSTPVLTSETRSPSASEDVVMDDISEEHRTDSNITIRLTPTPSPTRELFSNAVQHAVSPVARLSPIRNAPSSNIIADQNGIYITIEDMELLYGRQTPQYSNYPLPGMNRAYLVDGAEVAYNMQYYDYYDANIPGSSDREEPPLFIRGPPIIGSGPRRRRENSLSSRRAQPSRNDFYQSDEELYVNESLGADMTVEMGVNINHSYDRQISLALEIEMLGEYTDDDDAESPVPTFD